MIRIAIIEDTEEDAKTLGAYCDRYAKENGKQFTVEIFHNGLDFVTSSQFDYDIILLDIKMPYMNGLQTAQKIRESNENVVIVFITDMQQYAIHGYEVQATDFIVKPVKYSVFDLKFSRIVSVAEKRQGHTVAVKTGKATKYLKVSDIFYVESQKHKLIYHTASGDHETWGTMKEVCDSIRSFGFALCNSGYFVNLRYVDELNGSYVIVNGDSLPISRMKRKSFLDALTVYGK